MAHYGMDYTGGRYIRRGRMDRSRGYDAGYSGGWGGERGSWGARGEEWGRDEGDRWGGPNRFRTGREFGEGWGGSEGWGGEGYGGRQGRGRREMGDWPGMGGSGLGGRFEGTGEGQGWYDREMRGYRGRMGGDYDVDFGDRIRRGWNRLREEARDWMGRGYDRGW
jgi:hypothetical protein